MGWTWQGSEPEYSKLLQPGDVRMKLPRDRLPGKETYGRTVSSEISCDLVDV